MINIFASLTAYALALWLSLTAKNASKHLLLAIIALHSLAVLIVKTSSLATDHSSARPTPPSAMTPWRS
jgi:hypothetical protein